MNKEVALTFECQSQRLVGVLHRAADGSRTGIIVIVGGPQYRVGSHRQFVLLARSVAAAGIPVLRFDYRGMGDSEGGARDFERVDEDIAAAIDTLLANCPNLDSVVLLGLCDAASASLMYASSDSRVTGQILLNPWVRTEQGEARSYLRHYYLQRLLQRSFWSKVFRGRANLLRSGREFFESIGKARDARSSTQENTRNFIDRMHHGLSSFEGRVLFLISENDLTAGEFTDLCGADRSWKSAMSGANIEVERVQGADHTLSDRRHLDYVNSLIIKWINR